MIYFSNKNYGIVNLFKTKQNTECKHSSIVCNYLDFCPKNVQHNALQFVNLNYHVDEKKIQFFFFCNCNDNLNGMGVCPM